MDYKNKYLKYKQKYIALKAQSVFVQGGSFKQKYIDLKNQTAGVYIGTNADGSLTDIPDLMFYHETAKHWSLKQALKFSHIRQDTRRFVAEMPWDFYNTPIPDNMPLNVFNRIFPNRIFPNAVGINISYRIDITDDDFIHLTQIKKLNMSWCYQPSITDTAFTHLTNLTTLNMSRCDQQTITLDMRAQLRHRIPNFL